MEDHTISNHLPVWALTFNLRFLCCPESVSYLPRIVWLVSLIFFIICSEFQKNSKTTVLDHASILKKCFGSNLYQLENTTFFLVSMRFNLKSVPKIREHDEAATFTMVYIHMYMHFWLRKLLT